MHELLYLKDEQIKEFIEKLYIVYRELLNDAKPVLNQYSLGLAHQKVIHILSMYDGITISDLLKKLSYLVFLSINVSNPLPTIEAILLLV